MIEMPSHRPTPGAAPNAATHESAADAPDGAFAEMLSRNLGRGLVRRANPHDRETDQDAAQGGGSGGTPFYQGTVMAAPNGIATASGPAFPAGSPPGGGQAEAAVTRFMTPAAMAVAARHSGATPGGESVPTIPLAAAGATAAGGFLGPDTTGSGNVPAGPARIQDPWQTGPLEPMPEAPPRQAIAPQTIIEDGVIARPALIGEPASGPGVLDSPRLGASAAAARSATTVAWAPQNAAPAPETLEGTPTAVAAPAPAAPAPADPRAIENTVEPTATAPPVADAGAATQPPLQSRPQAAPNTHLIDRVLRMVEYQQTQPPPRMVVVDMPEIEGLRLMVAMQADGKVHVAPIAGSAPQHVAEPFLQAVGEALAAEGFDLAADSQQRQRRDRPESEEPAPATRRIGRRRRATGLRL